MQLKLGEGGKVRRPCENLTALVSNQIGGMIAPLRNSTAGE